METKKKEKANLQNKRLIFFEIGLVVALVAAIFVFRLGTSDKMITIHPSDAPLTESELYIPSPTSEPPQEQSSSPTRAINPEIIRIVPDHMVPRMSENVSIGEFFNNLPEGTGRIGRSEPPGGGDDEPFIKVEQMPRFQGGTVENFRNWVMGRIVYPQQALDSRMTGKVIVEFVIEKDGSLTNINVIQSPDNSFSRAVVKVLEQSPLWEPGRQRRQPARVKFTIPVDFVIQN